MEPHKARAIVEKALAQGNGILRLKPAWVARDFLPPGYRLGLKEEEYDVGERGYICERWLASVTKADNRIGPPDEGLSYLALDSGEQITLKEAVDVAGAEIMGAEYARTHKGLGRLAKIYDFAARIPYHIHQRKEGRRAAGPQSQGRSLLFPRGIGYGATPGDLFRGAPLHRRTEKDGHPAALFGGMEG